MPPVLSCLPLIPVDPIPPLCLPSDIAPLALLTHALGR